MSKRIGVRAATKEAFRMAAAMVENADFYSLFGELYEDMTEQDDCDSILAQAQGTVVRRIREIAEGRS